MKRINKLLICILLVFLVVAIFALTSCDDKPKAKQLTDLTLPELNDHQIAIVIKNGNSDYTSYTVNLDTVGIKEATCADVLEYMSKHRYISLTWQDSTYGKYIEAIGGINPDSSKNEYVEIFTSNPDFQGTWADVTTITAGDVTLKSAAVGVSELGVKAGDVVYFELASY